MFDINKKKPECNMREGSDGIEVFVKPYSEETAFYGKKYSRLPCFYKHGEKLTGITHWEYLGGNDD